MSCTTQESFDRTASNPGSLSAWYTGPVGPSTGWATWKHCKGWELPFRDCEACEIGFCESLDAWRDKANTSGCRLKPGTASAATIIQPRNSSMMSSVSNVRIWRFVWENADAAPSGCRGTKGL